jgi:hypothetical protein
MAPAAATGTRKKALERNPERDDPFNPLGGAVWVVVTNAFVAVVAAAFLVFV